jgi:hypothetical protein
VIAHQLASYLPPYRRGEDATNGAGDRAEMAERYGAGITVPERRKRLGLFAVRQPRCRHGSERYQAVPAKAPPSGKWEILSFQLPVSPILTNIESEKILGSLMLF